MFYSDEVKLKRGIGSQHNSGLDKENMEQSCDLGKVCECSRVCQCHGDTTITALNVSGDN